MDLEEFTGRLDNVKELPSGTSARCPAHDDHVSSLVVNVGRDGGIVLHCHAGCDARDVITALGLSMMDLMGTPRLLTVHEYRDEQGDVRYSVERWANPKTFRCVPGLPPPRQRILYQAGALAWARAHQSTVYVVEGEKDADTLIAAGVIATTNVTGAGSWLPHYADQLAGCHVVIVSDNDSTGRDHARKVFASVQGTAASVALTVPRFGKDVSELLGAGYTLDHLDPLPEWEEVTSYIASSVRTRKVRWAWQDYFPLGKLSIVEGDPGDGKSILSIDLAARWSTGAPMPDGSNGAGPWPVILVSAEDDPEDTIVPRLMAAGARLDFCHLITHGIARDIPFDFASGLPGVRALAERVGARAVLFDPLMAFIGAQTDTNNDASVRRALQPLKVLAEMTEAAVVAIRHLNKGGSGSKAIYRGGGSVGFTGAARATFLVTADRQDPSNKIMAAVKTNLSARPPSLRYRVQLNPEGMPFITWGGAVAIDAQQALDGPEFTSEAQEDRSVKREQRRYEIEFLTDLLEANGSMSWKEIVAAGKDEGFTERGLRGARVDAHLDKTRGSEGNRSTRWTLPTVANGEDADQAHLPFAGPGEPPSGGLETARKWESVSSGPLEGQVIDSHTVTDADRDAELRRAELVCSICGSVDGCLRFGEPWWEVRCPAHNPFIYGAGE
jgi:5S rRNA maturation endonuclease (ribonuclease M5)